MDNVERAYTDAKFGVIMADLEGDSVFNYYYGKLEERAADSDTGTAG